MASAKIKLSVLKKSSSTAPSKAISKEASPDSKCPICLDQFKNISYVDKCLHRFCFRCIHEWSKNKAECPLCKQPFSSIYHSIKAEDDFKQYDLRPSDNGSFGNLAGQRFRYRTTLTGDRRPERRTSPPPDHGVMFEGLSGSVSHGNDRGFHRMLARLAARQRAQGEGRALRTLREQEMIQFRRTLYRRGLRVRDVRDGGRSRETSAEFFRGNPACLHRLVPWLKRELTVLYGTHGSLVNIVQHIVMSQITRYDMQDPAVLQELRPFLLSRTEHFLHEFLCFARSPFNMEAYDQNAVYDCPAPSAEDSGGSDSSVITVSEDEANLPHAAAPAMLSQAPWDDETPGPSYSTEPPRVLTVSVNSSDSDSEEEAGPSAAPVAPAAPARVVTGEEHHSGTEEDCVIVGYVKPTAERTPELVQLSSDSEEEDEEEETKNNRLIKTTLPQHIRFTSPPDSPSSSQSAAPHRSTAVDRNRPSLDQSHDWHSTSPRCSSKKHQSRSNSDDGRRHSKSKRKDGSRNRDVYSRGHKGRSRSKDRKQSKETLSFHRSHTHLPHTQHSYKSSRYYSHTHYSSVRRSPEKHARSHPRSRDRSQEQSWDNSHDWSWEHSHTRSREHSHSWSRDRSCAHSRSRSRSRRSRSRRSRSRRSRSRRSRSWNRRQTRHPSPSSTHRNSRHDKPSGKRKYKSLHLEPSGTEATEGLAQDKKKRSRGKHEGKRERRRRSSRSPSVEIVYEGDSGEALQKKRHRKKKKHKKKSKRKRSKERRERKSPTIITINSESDSDGHRNEAAVNHPSANNTIEANSGSVTSNISIPSGKNKAVQSLLMDSNANNTANDANSSSMTSNIPVHSASHSDQNKTALSLNMSHTATNANDASDSNGANSANSTSIPSNSPEEPSQLSRTVMDPAEPPLPPTSTAQPHALEQNTLAFAGHK